MNKLIALAILLVTGSVAHALVFKNDESKSPLGCKDLGYQYKLNLLKIKPHIEGDRQSLYFIFNKLNQPVKLYQMLKGDSSRSMPLNHVINGQQWSVLATSEKELNYICAVDATATKRGTVVDCSNSVKVCEYARVKFGLNNRGNYWFLNSTSRNSAVNDALHYGIIPR